MLRWWHMSEPLSPVAPHTTRSYCRGSCEGDFGVRALGERDERAGGV